MQTDNRTIYGIKDTERYILISWSITVLLTSLLGDTIILVSTIKYSAIKQNKAVVTVMQHMAVCDLLQTIFRVVPCTIALIADDWIVGTGLCQVEESIRYVGSVLTMFLTCALAGVKLVIVKFPLRIKAWSSRLGHKVCTYTWVLVLIWYAPMIAVKIFCLSDTVYFSYEYVICTYDFEGPSTPPWYKWYRLITGTTIALVTYTTLVVSSVLILGVASRAGSRHGEKVRREGVIAVLLTVGILLVSTLPTAIAIVGSDALGMDFNPTFLRAVMCLTLLNIMANFFVYSLAVQSFREFLKLCIFQFVFLFGLSNGDSTLKRQPTLQLPLCSYSKNSPTASLTRSPRSPIAPRSPRSLRLALSSNTNGVSSPYSNSDFLAISSAGVL